MLIIVLSTWAVLIPVGYGITVPPQPCLVRIISRRLQTGGGRSSPYKTVTPHLPLQDSMQVLGSLASHQHGYRVPWMKAISCRLHEVAGRLDFGCRLQQLNKSP